MFGGNRCRFGPVLRAQLWILAGLVLLISEASGQSTPHQMDGAGADPADEPIDEAATSQTALLQIRGTVFEDIHYGGGEGRSFAVASADAPGSLLGRPGVSVELYDALGNLADTETTGADGSYDFVVITPGLYTVRIVNGDVTSTRVGSDGSEIAVQTYRASGTLELPAEGAKKVGGEQPTSTDAPKNNGFQSLADLQSPVGQFTQSIVAVSSLVVDVNDVDFGFSFSSIVNGNDSGQGSFRQFLHNANLLGGDSDLEQDGLLSATETSVFMIPGSGDLLGRPSDPTENSGSNTNGAFTIALLSPLPAITSRVHLDGYTQEGATPNDTPPPSFPDSDLRIELNGLGAGAADGLSINADSVSVRGFVINRFAGDAIDLDGASRTTVVGCFLGSGVDGLTARSNSGSGVALRNGASFNEIGGTSDSEINVVAYNLQAGIRVEGSASDHNSIQRNAIFENGGLGIELVDSGANDDKTPPSLSSIVSAGNDVLISGTTDPGDIVEFFRVVNDQSPTTSPDPSGAGEGYGAVPTSTPLVEGGSEDLDAAVGSFQFLVPQEFGIGRECTATATASTGATSEFATNAWVPLRVEKRAFDVLGNSIGSSEMLARGSLVRYLLYINNRGASRTDVSLTDVLDSTFEYQPGTIHVSVSSPACADFDCTSLEESTILSAALAEESSTDSAGDDEASVSGSTTIYIGNSSEPSNAQLDVAADKVVAVAFTVKMR